MDWLRIAPNGILILGGSRSDAWNASVRTRGTSANCGVRCVRQDEGDGRKLLDGVV